MPKEAHDGDLREGHGVSRVDFWVDIDTMQKPMTWNIMV
jgi:hypothetical protein